MLINYRNIYIECAKTSHLRKSTLPSSFVQINIFFLSFSSARKGLAAARGDAVALLLLRLVVSAPGEATEALIVEDEPQLPQRLISSPIIRLIMAPYPAL